MKLDDIDKKNIFKQPDEDYFDQLPLRIRDKIDQPRGSYQPVLNWRWASGFAAVLIAVAVLFLVMPEATISNSDPLADVSDEALIEYLENSGITTDEVLSYVEAEDIRMNDSLDENDALEGLDFLDFELDDELDFM